MTSLDKFFKKIYNIILLAREKRVMTDKAYRWNKEKAGKIVKKNLRHMKNTLEQKINIYEPLDIDTTYQEFLAWLQKEEFKVIREIPAGCKAKAFFLRKILASLKTKVILNDLLKDFLIQRAYYNLAERYIQQRVKNKLGPSDPNDIRVLEIADFVMKEIETDGLARLKKFREKSKFKYFLGTVVTMLIFDSWRQHYKTQNHLTKFAPEFEDLFDRPVDDPFDRIIASKDEEIKAKAAEILPQILENLRPKEKLAIKWKYEEGMTISAMARAFGTSRYKTEKFIEELEQKISKKIFNHTREKTMNKGGKNETP